MRWILAPALATLCSLPGISQQRLTSNAVSDPAIAVFAYEDVERFVVAHRAIRAGRPVGESLQNLYFDRASPGLKMYMEKYDLDVPRLEAALIEHPEAYERIPSVLKALIDNEDSFRETYGSLAAVIPDAVFPPTYFLVAGHRGIGSGSTEGPLLSIEKRTPESVSTDLKATLVHEMIHMEQLASVREAYFSIFSGSERTLLALSIREGAATFFAEVIAGGSEHKNRARQYLVRHEKELWQAFRSNMLTGETGDWLWKTPSNPEQPQDLGYAMGARIVETFYEGAADKRRAAREIMAITGYEDFLRHSGYGRGMETE